MKKNGKKSESKNDIIPEMKEEFKRHTTALMEHMTKEVKIGAEGHSILVKKIDNIESELGEVKKDVNELKNDVHELKDDVHGLKKDVTIIKSELHSVKMVVTAISHETNNHEKRIKRVEEKVFV